MEGVEDQAGVAGADLVGCETADHFVDSVLQVRLAGGELEAKGLTATAAPGWVVGRLAGGVVVVARRLLAGGRAEAQRCPPSKMWVQRVRISLMTSMVLFMDTPSPGVLSCAKSSEEKA